MIVRGSQTRLTEKSRRRRVPSGQAASCNTDASLGRAHPGANAASPTECFRPSDDRRASRVSASTTEPSLGVEARDHCQNQHNKLEIGFAAFSCARIPGRSPWGDAASALQRFHLGGSLKSTPRSVRLGWSLLKLLVELGLAPCRSKGF